MLYVVIFGDSKFITFYADSNQDAEKLGRQLADAPVHCTALVIAN